MIKVKIKDFESISDLSFEIKGFTVVVGRNNLGKSAIVRAIDAALTNRTGNEFIRWGKLKTEVDIKKDGLSIEWKKGEKSVYKVNDQPYSGLNRSVPKTILDAGFRQMEIGDEKCNPLVAHQFEELFLINQPGPTVTEVLSKIYNINVINEADALCQKSLRASKSLLKTRESDLIKLTDQLLKFKEFDEIKTKNEALKVLCIKKEKLEKDLSEIDLYETELKKLSFSVNRLKGIKNLKVPVVEKEESDLNDYQWLNAVCDKFRLSVESLQRLKPATLLTLPDTLSAETSIFDYQWLESVCKKFHETLEIVQKIKPVTLLIFPDTTKMSALIPEISILNDLVERFKKSVL
jgi:energy-coupling factor transporter ATP-binding protein EcfA2